MQEPVPKPIDRGFSFKMNLKRARGDFSERQRYGALKLVMKNVFEKPAISA